MTSTEKLDTHRQALTVNLDASTFGSFAEIGARAGSCSLVPFRRRCLWHRCQKHFRLRQGGQRQSLRDRFTLWLQGAAGSHAGDRVDSIARPIRQDSRQRQAVLLFCRYCVRAKLRRNKRCPGKQFSCSHLRSSRISGRCEPFRSNKRG